MPEWTPDPVVQRFVPDPELEARVQRDLKRREEEMSPRQARVRQQWEAAMAATRVALDSLRDIWPTEAQFIPPQDQDSMVSAVHSIEDAYHKLDELSEALLGVPMNYVLEGVVRTHERLDDLGVPR